MSTLIIPERRRSLGRFDVGRVLPYPGRQMVGPFIFFDHMGPVDLPRGLAADADVRPHPHIGLATVTYLFAGEVMHRDSTAVEQPIRPGEVNWMVAGRGITHSERFERARREGGALHGIQAWVALPNECEETTPAFHHHEGGDLPAAAVEGGEVRVLAGEAYGLRSRVRTHSPLFYAHAQLEAGARLELPSGYAERASFLVSGAGRIEGLGLAPGQMFAASGAGSAVFEATAPSVLMLLGGEPVGPRFIEWNFVSSSRERIEAAKADWRAGRMKLPDADHEEFIPLPE
ncbi:MAG: pirin family protein [Proteobacteria bacterium]|nr:pirin family protein [Pseudomonadota bacterium]